MINGKTLVKSILIAGWMYALPVAAESETGPAGYWKTFDLDKVPRSIVQFSANGDELTATIVKVIPSKEQSADAVCSRCEGPLKDQPLIGMRIIWGAKKQGDRWTEGYVLDTDSGNTYRCNISTSADGKVLYMHAYAGAPIFGKTVEWLRASKEEVPSENN